MGKDGFFAKAIAFLRVLIVAAPLLAFSGVAAADGLSLGLEGDPSDTTLNQVLVPVFGSAASSGSTATSGASDAGMATLIGRYNGAVLLLASLVMGYTIVAGTLGTAHHGEMLGKWSSIWVPVRMIFGVGMMIPLSSGYCAAQLMVFWLIGQGNAIASGGWQSYADNALASSDTIQAPYAMNAGMLAKGMFDRLVCVERYNAVAKSNDTGFGSQTIAGATGDLSASGGTRYYGFTNGSGPRDACGTIEFPGVSTSTANQYDQSIATKIGQAHIEATMEMENSLRPLAAQAAAYGGDMPSGLASSIDSAASAYIQKIAAASQQTSNSEIQDSMKAMNAKGWIYAGFRYTAMMSAGTTAASASTGGPTPSGSIQDNLDVNAALANSNAAVKASEKSFWEKTKDAASHPWDTVTEAGKSAMDKVSSAANSAIDSVAGFGRMMMDMASKVSELDPKKIISEACLGLTANVVNAFANAGPNPYAAGINVGHTIMAWVEGIVVALGVLSLFVGIFAAGFWTSPVGVILTALFGIAYGAGVTLTLLPLVPVMVWIGFVVSWTLMCVEAILAAPLWMLAHLSPEAEGFTGKGSDGYLLIAAVILRPILGLMGLAAAFATGSMASQLLTSVFVPVMKASAGNNMIGLGSMVAMICAYVTCQITILTGSFKAVSAVPDAVMRWVGGSGAHGGIGQVGDSHDKGAEALHSASTGAVAGGLASMGRNGQQVQQPDRNERKLDESEKKIDRKLDMGFKALSKGDKEGAEKHFDAAQKEQSRMEGFKGGSIRSKYGSSQGKIDDAYGALNSGSKGGASRGSASSSKGDNPKGDDKQDSSKPK